MAPRTTPQEYHRARKAYSELQRQRLAAPCKEYLPKVLHGQPEAVMKEAVPGSPQDWEAIKGLFPATCDTPLVEFVAGAAVAPKDRAPLKVGVVLSGGQAPGGHNVIAGIFDGVKNYHKDSVMIGFLDGPHGVFTGNFVEITPEIMDGFRNTGGFDMLGSGRHKIESEEQFQDSMAVCTAIGLDGLVVIGGDDSNTNGALLAEYFKAKGCKTKVVGAPKTIDGDLKCPPHLPISFGFDSACRTYATLVANVSVDVLSAQKYYHLVRLMGRSASNIALEVALLTRPNACLLGEEVSRDKKSLQAITTELVDMIEQRSKLGKDYGVIVLPEGLIEFIPEFNALMSELNDKLADEESPTEEKVRGALSPENRAVFEYLPDFIRAQLLLDRDPHGNVQVAKIETEKLLAATIAAELKLRRERGSYDGTFVPQFHSYGYEGRAGMPTIFDACYCYALGATAANLLASGCTGLIASVTNLLQPVAEWKCGGVPVTSLCVLERRKGKSKPVIRKALVELEGPLSQPYKYWCLIREHLRLEDCYRNPGPTQYDMQNCEASKEIPITLQLELGKQLEPLKLNPTPKKMGQFLYIPQSVESRSEIQRWHMGRKNRVPKMLAEFSALAVQLREAGSTMVYEKEEEVLRKHFHDVNAPLLELRATEERGAAPAAAKVGVLFSGRQAPGCHDLVCGMVDMLSGLAGAQVLGFVGGTQGLFGKHYIELTKDLVQSYRGTGGLEMLGRTVDRLKTTEELEQARAVCEELGLGGLVLVGGARTNADAAYVAEHFHKKGSGCAVVGVPCGIEGSLMNEFIEASIGFDSSAKAMAQLVGNTAIDGSSARKYYYFMKLMDGSTTGGKTSTSHVALEAALSTKPNLLLLTEEVDRLRLSLRDVVMQVADVVCQRAEKGKNFGTVIVAEGLLGAIPEFRTLIQELDQMELEQFLDNVEEVLPNLSQWSRALFESMPEFIQKQLLIERQSNVAVTVDRYSDRSTQLETERLIAWLVEDELSQRKAKGLYKGSFSAVCQFLGYQARCSIPSAFDSDYAYTLGGTAAVLAAGGKSGYMATVFGLSRPVEEWSAGGVPFTAMMRVPASSPSEVTRPRPTILPTQVDLEGPAFKAWKDVRDECAHGELYESPGPIQLSGPSAGVLSRTIATKHSYVKDLRKLCEDLAEISTRCRPGCDPRTVSVASQSLKTLNDVLDEILGHGKL